MNAPFSIAPQKLLPVEWPKGICHQVPYAVFSSKEIYDVEQEKIFRGPTWNYVGLEAEIPNPGDYKSTFVGDTPIVITRAEDGSVHGWVNRCAHRGALVCRELKGNVQTHTCVYHQWSFDAKGDLVGVPFRRGIAGKGGYPKDFKLEEHPLQKLNIGVLNGVIFASFAQDMPSVEQYLGADISHHLKRVFHKPVEVIGYARQYLYGNWKFYAENTRDPYHASLLHLFHATFGLYRSTLEGGQIVSPDNRHSVLWVIHGSDTEAQESYKEEKLRTYQPETYSLQDPSLLQGRPEFEDRIGLMIFSAFPNLVIQQIANTLATRQIVARAPGEMELVWTYFGYKDDDPELRAYRLKQMNLIGPAGLISMEDGESTEICQQATVRDGDQFSCVELDGREPGPANHLVTESGIRGFWAAYRQLMDL